MAKWVIYDSTLYYWSFAAGKHNQLRCWLPTGQLSMPALGALGRVPVEDDYQSMESFRIFILTTTGWYDS
jgi:hypothetical protein